MNADELKLITDMISLLSVQGKEAFVWFLALKYGAPLLLHLVLWPCAFVVVIKIVSIINGQEEAIVALRAIRTILFPHLNGYITRDQIDSMLKAIQTRNRSDSSR